MTCANCGMAHRPKENRLCAGPFITIDEHAKIVANVAQQFYLMRNQYNHRMRTFRQAVPQEDLDVIIGCQAEIERNR